MKIIVVGAGNGGCISALQCLKSLKQFDIEGEVEICYDPNIAIEKVGQGGNRPATKLISEFVEDWDDFVEKTGATLKTGIFYENWGTENKWNFHPVLKAPRLVDDYSGYTPDNLFEYVKKTEGADTFWANAFHYIPKKFSEYILGLKQFKVTEKNIVDPESELDCDVIIDCRGKSDSLTYEKAINPLNSAIISRKNVINANSLWSGHIATPNGWTFEIPNLNDTSYGYMYNSDITSKEDATLDFVERFEVEPMHYIDFDSYWVKDPFVGERTFVNGNRHSFVEPMEASSTSVYTAITRYALESFIGGKSKEYAVNNILHMMWKWENLFLWNYHSGSIYDTPFWNYAKNLEFREEVRDIFKVLSKAGNGAEVLTNNDNYKPWRKIKLV